MIRALIHPYGCWARFHAVQTYVSYRIRFNLRDVKNGWPQGRQQK